MKKIYLLMLLLATVFVACSDDDDKDKETPWEIKMTIEVKKENEEISFTAYDAISNAKIIESVDWGDGNIDENISRDLTHYYSTGTYNITVKGKGEINWSCSDNNITALDVTKCTTLVCLSCGDNQLTSLDVSKCPELYLLECTNNQLTLLDVTQCPKLARFVCFNNQLTSLDVTKCTNLMWLNCSDNQLTSLDVSKCPTLRELYCGGNNFDNNAMNAIYNGLPDQKGDDYHGIINLYKDDAKGNTTIALNKNWKVEY